MTALQILVLVLVFLSVGGLTLAAFGYFMPRAIDLRLKQALGAPPLASGNAPVWQEKLMLALSPAAKLTLPREGWENSPLRQKFITAGLRGQRAPIIFFAVKTGLLLMLPLLALLVVSLSNLTLTSGSTLMLAWSLAALGYYLPNIWLSRRVERRQRDIFETLPDAVDLLTVMVEAGLGLDGGIARAGEEMGMKSSALQEELRLVGLELRAGASREQALRNLALRTGVRDVDMLVTMLIQADRFGTSMADSLRVHADSLRTKRQLAAEEAAAKIPLKLLFPLIFCIFPSLMIVLIGPAAIRIYRVFVSHVS